MTVNRLIVLALLILSTSCGRRAQIDPADAAKAEALWQQHENAVVRALHGVSRGEEFAEASLFFHQLTGIQIHGDGSFVGWLPTAGAEQDLQRLRLWHRWNQGRIYWDEKSHSVKVLPPT